MRFSEIFISPTEDRLRCGWRVLLQAALFVVLLIAFVIAAAAFPYLFTIPNWLENEHLLAAFGVGVILLIISASVLVARKCLDRRSFRSLGLQVNGWAQWEFLIGFAMMALVMGSIFGMQWALGWIRIRPAPAISGELVGHVAIWFVLFIPAAFGEELLFRGYWLQNLEDGLSEGWGVILSSIAFAIYHTANPGFGLPAFFGLFLAGVLLSYAYVRTRRLWLATGVHAGWNFFEGPVFGFPVSGLDMPKLIEHRSTGPWIWTGGDFGPEAGLIALPAMVLAACMISLFPRSDTGNSTGGSDSEPTNPTA